MSTFTAVRRSMMWSAYGDALGFITEGVDEAGVRRRVGSPTVERLQGWRRRVGGRAGADVPLPPGTYSDDTQLRLATCRAIRSDGSFDVEAFAGLELPVWTAYALGGGRGSKAAARNLARRSAAWFSNFYKGYTAGGGNGAAMRIQPHVWAAPNQRLSPDVLPAVLQNAVTTHGHPRGLLGAVFHAECLSHVLTTGELPTVNGARGIAQRLRAVPTAIASDLLLGKVWLSRWEGEGRSFADSVGEVIGEVDGLLDQMARSLDSGAEYGALVDAVDGRSPATRGSGTITAVLALAAALMYGPERTHEALAAIANTLGSDTDSIATMAGALLGGLAKEDPPAVQDVVYLTFEAQRLWLISKGSQVLTFPYPDLAQWRAPDAIADYVVQGPGGRLVLAGIGELEALRQPVPSRTPDFVWQWMRTTFGQSILAKRRSDVRDGPSDAEPRQAVAYARDVEAVPVRRGGSQVTLFEHAGLEERSLAAAAGEQEPRPTVRADFAQMLAELRAKSFDAALLGHQLKRLSRHRYGVELCAAYSGLVASALKSGSSSS